MVHVFKGMAGSVRSVVCHPTLPLVASCGLDRFFRLHDLQTHMLLSKVVVGNSRGRVALLDLRRKGMVHVFKGMAGSVRSVVCHPTLPLVASCGLDRFFRLHDLHTHMLLSKMYLKSRLNCLLLRTDFSVSEEAEKREDAEAEPADDEIWQDMEEVEEAAEEPQAAQKRTKKKKPSVESRKRKKVCRSDEIYRAVQWESNPGLSDLQPDAFAQRLEEEAN
ncbi:hypothetical protein HPB47_009515 [Ixodes persulcatus]|uniref:Uncharacterized protein n=1 Tax=Ixodes persulcatus TaxID=34615 RepID=A0AC60P1Z8_IXOPE|nr:hypothetical protein HPB47_009515 [Ixodes persulcatus]